MHRNTLQNLGLSNGFLDMTPNGWPIKEIIEKLNFIKIKNFSASKDIIKKLEQQHTEWGKIFANHIPDKQLVSRIYKSQQLNEQRIWINIFSKGDIHMTDNHMNRSLL